MSNPNTDLGDWLIRDAVSYTHLDVYKRQDVIYKRFFHERKGGFYIISIDFSIDNILLCESESISETSSSCLGNDFESFFRGFNSFFFGDKFQSFYNILFANFSKVKYQRTRSDSLRNLVNLCCCKNEDDMIWWFFECLEKCINCLLYTSRCV